MRLKWPSVFKKWFGSLYIKIFLSFLAVCVLFFMGLALFWNYYFTDLFYESKKDLLQERHEVVTAILNNVQEGTLSTREVRFAAKIIARSINGSLLLVDAKGNILNGSSEREGTTIPKALDSAFIEALKGHSGFQMTMMRYSSDKRESVLTHYGPYQLGGQPIVIFLQVPALDISEAISAVRVNILVPLLFSLLAVGTILYVISRKLAGPIHQMNEAALQLAQGNLLTRVPVTSNDEVGELAKSFNFMVDQLRGWEDARQEFLANVSHELRSPLTSLRGLIVAMNDKVISEDQYSHYLKICDGEVQRLQRLVNDLLDLARIQNGVDVFRMRPVVLKEAIEDVLELMKSRLAEKDIRLRFVRPEEHNPALMAEASVDPDRFAQILQNLLTNAIQFTPAGGQVTVSLAPDEEEVHVYVSDTGIGMSDDEMARIWDRFYKADISRSASSDGTGLGLTIVKHLVNGMGGTISVRSRLGEGTEFKISFPRVKKE